MINRLLALILLLSITGCAAERHLSKAQKHIDIAKRKGAVIKPDTVWQYNYSKEFIFDTITNTYKEVVKKDSVFYSVNTTISAGLTRQERLVIESYYKHLEKMMKLQNDSLSKELKAYIKINRQESKTERHTVKQENKSNGWLWTLLPWSIIALYIFYRLKLQKLNRL